MSEVAEKTVETAIPVGEPVVEAAETPEVAVEGSSKNKKKKKKKNNNIKDITSFYPDEIYPEGQWMDYNLKRTTEAEERYLARDAENAERWNDVRKAAEIHRRVRKNLQNKIRPGLTTTEICDIVESATRKFTAFDDANPLRAGVGFPTGVSINDCAAHYTPNAGDKTVLKHEDVMKVDFGVHINGYIIDSAWTVTFDPQYDELLKAVREATETGVREAGIDVRLTDIGEAIQETMESYEVEIDGETLPVKCLRNLCGHSIGQYRIHAGKSVPIVKNGDETKMEEGEHFAIETFGTTGRGYVFHGGEVSHYAMNTGLPKNAKLRVAGSNKAMQLYDVINSNFGTLPWCRRYLDRLGQDKYLFGLNQLVKADIVQEYPPLWDVPGSYTAQYEHTILLHPHKKEVVSRGEDY